MSSLETTELKLKTTPTGGVSGEHSPYYRRLLSAGYKGFLQGTIAGSGLYGLMGAVIGGVLVLPALFIPGVNIGAAMMLIPALGGVGVLKGASTFGNIGSIAAISAESADLSEERRYLLDRYYDLPDTPDGNAQADVIAQRLSKQHTSGQHHSLFHWKTVAICAAIGGLLALGFVAFPPLVTIIEHTTLYTALEAMGSALAEHALFASAGHALPVVGAAMGTAFGALAGATVGLDRHYVRKWFDGSEKLLHDDSHSWNATQERSQLVEKLKDAAVTDQETKLILERRGNLYSEQPVAAPAPQMIKTTPAPVVAAQPKADVVTASADPAARPIANLDSPSNTISDATLKNRVAALQKAMDIPIA